jgi:hypothetical protein
MFMWSTSPRSFVLNSGAVRLTYPNKFLNASSLGWDGGTSSIWYKKSMHLLNITHEDVPRDIVLPGSVTPAVLHTATARELSETLRSIGGAAAAFETGATEFTSYYLFLVARVLKAGGWTKLEILQQDSQRDASSLDETGAPNFLVDTIWSYDEAWFDLHTGKLSQEGKAKLDAMEHGEGLRHVFGIHNCIYATLASMDASDDGDRLANFVGTLHNFLERRQLTHERDGFELRNACAKPAKDLLTSSTCQSLLRARHRAASGRGNGRIHAPSAGRVRL